MKKNIFYILLITVMFIGLGNVKADQVCCKNGRNLNIVYSSENYNSCPEAGGRWVDECNNSCSNGTYIVSATCVYGDPFAFKNEYIPNNANITVRYGKKDDDKTYIKYDIYNFSSVNDTYKQKTISYNSKELKYSDFFKNNECPENIYTGTEQVYEEYGKFYKTIPLLLNPPGDEWTLIEKNYGCSSEKPDEKIDNQYVDDDNSIDHNDMINAYNNGEESYINKNQSTTDKSKRPTDDLGTTVYTCEDLIGENVLHFLKLIRNFIMIIGPILALVLGTYDLVVAMASGEDDAKKKGMKKMKNRIVAAVLLLLVPYILMFIVSLVNKGWSSCV